MHTMAQLMRQGHDIAGFSQIVQHDVGVNGGHGRVGKSARCLARLYACINPAIGEEGLGNLGHLWGKFAIGGQHHISRLGPVHQLWRFKVQGRVAVPDLQLVQPQPFGFQPIVAVRELGIGCNHRIAQGLHHLRLHMVGQMAAILGRGHLAPAVINFLFLGQGVVHAGKELHMLVKHRRQRACRRLTLGAVGVRQQVQRRLKVQLLRLTLDGEHEPRHGLIKQLVPRACPHDRGIVQVGLQLVRQLVRTHRAHAVKDRLVARKIGVLGHAVH